MNYCTFSDLNNTYTTAVLVKKSYFDQKKIQEYYINPVEKQGIQSSDIIAFDLEYPSKKITVAQARAYLNKLLPSLVRLGITTLYCTDATYFKALTKQTKTGKHLGYVLSCKLAGYEHISIILGLNYGQLIYNPNLYSKLDLSLETLVNHLNGNYQELGKDLIHYANYPITKEEIQWQLDGLLHHQILTCDIETYSLSLKDAGLATIAFAWSKHKGIAFKVIDTRQLKLFFEKYNGKLIFHNASFDIRNVIFTCFMRHPTDYQGMLHGLHTMTKNIHDTQIITYLATNSTAGNKLGLKELSHKFTGNYAEDVTDITKVALDDLLIYNLKDCLATMYVYEKYIPIMLKDNQLDIYNNIMLPSLKTIIQMELTGMPMDMPIVIQTKDELTQLSQNHIKAIQQSQYVIQAEKELKQKKLDKINSKLKTKQHGLEKVSDYEFNPNSNDHLRYLLYSVIGLPIIDTTATKQPATGGETLKKLIHQTNNQDVKDLINHIIGLNDISKILSTFIPAFEQSFKKDDWHYLHGNFNLGGTLSGRLSSSKPNLQNLPSGSTYGKTIKKCFKAPKGWLFVGADFASLEDRINALLTKDSNKLKVYTDGYDGHSLRAYYYWKDRMPDISLNNINDIKNKYPQYRQASKAPTFALTYGGTYFTLMNNCGFNEYEAKQIEANYHELYKESDTWIKDKLDLCCKQGYIDVAFGLRIRTPLLAKSILGNSKTLYQASSEARSVGNAISGQSYGLLTNRAINEFMQRVWVSEYKYDIMPVSLIHDAIYLMIKNDINVVEYVNNNLIECMQWQDLEEIKHDKVHLEAELDIYYPDWSNPITLPNKANNKKIRTLCSNN